MLAAIDRARSAGVRVSFDVNYRSTLAPPDVAGPLLRKIAENADLVFGGADELRLLYPDGDAAEAADACSAAGCREVVLKHGADGAAVLRRAMRSSRVPDSSVDVVDTVGAGDAFVAGYLSALLEDLDVRNDLHRANACGAMLCMTPGDWEAAPTLRDLDRFLDGDSDPVRR